MSDENALDVTSSVATPTAPAASTPAPKTRGPRKNAISASPATSATRQRHNYQSDLADAKLEIAGLQNKITSAIRTLTKAEKSAAPQEFISLAIDTLSDSGN